MTGQLVSLLGMLDLLGHECCAEIRNCQKQEGVPLCTFRHFEKECEFMSVRMQEVAGAAFPCKKELSIFQSGKEAPKDGRRQGDSGRSVSADSLKAKLNKWGLKHGFNTLTETLIPATVDIKATEVYFLEF